MIVPHILFVSGRLPERALLASWLRDGGYLVTEASEFNEARRQFDVLRPGVLISDVKLHAYNGLHLAIWARSRGGPTRTILIGDADAVLQEEAARAQSLYLVNPVTREQLLECLRVVVDPRHSIRQSQRCAVRLPAQVGGRDVWVVDLSREGLRLEVQDAQGIALPGFFSVYVSGRSAAWRVRRIWTLRPPDSPNTLYCGVAFPQREGGGPSLRELTGDVEGGEPLPAAELPPR